MRQRGLRVLFDGVFSHVGREHPAVVQALREGSESEFGSLFDIDWQAVGGPVPRVFEGHDALVRLNHAASAAVDLVSDVMGHWLERGIDGWRLDAAYSVPTRFWAQTIGQARTRHPDAWFLGEVIHGDYPAFVTESTVDSVTQYELWKAIWSSLLDGNFFELEWSLRRHAQMLGAFIPNTFIGNHDVTRIATTLGHERALLALVVLLTVPGIPSIYYGDEVGALGLKEERVGGDDAIRPPLSVVSEVDGAGRAILDAHRALIALRRQHPWLTTASVETMELTNTRFRYRAAAAAGSATLEVHLDLGDRPSALIRNGETTLWQS